MKGKEITLLEAGRHVIYRFFDLGEQMILIKNIDGESIIVMKSALKDIAKILLEIYDDYEKMHENNNY